MTDETTNGCGKGPKFSPTPNPDSLGSVDAAGWYLADAVDASQKNVHMYFDGQGLCSRDTLEGQVVLYMDNAWTNFRRLVVAPAPPAEPAEGVELPDAVILTEDEDALDKAFAAASPKVSATVQGKIVSSEVRKPFEIEDDSPHELPALESLRSELARLNAELASLQKDFDEIHALGCEVQTKLTAAEQARDAAIERAERAEQWRDRAWKVLHSLRSITMSGGQGTSAYPTCPVCHEHSRQFGGMGHTNDCELDWLLCNAALIK